MDNFPITFFPKRLQDIIIEVSEAEGFNIDYLSASMLSAFSIATGNLVRLDFTKGWKSNCSLWIMIIGDPGVNKSSPLSWAVKPIELKDATYYKAYKEEYNQYLELIKNGNEKIKAPRFVNKTILDDITPEALYDKLYYNKRGASIVADEIKGYISNLNRYGNGSNLERQLSIWSGKGFSIDRKTDNVSQLIKDPFMSIVGTTQYSVLSSLMNNFEDNGYIERWLFVNPENAKKEKWSESKYRDECFYDYDRAIQRIMDSPMYYTEIDIVPHSMVYSEQAKKVLYVWQAMNTDKSNESPDKKEKGIRAKIETYVHRFALIHTVCDWSFNNHNDTISGVKEIGLEAVKQSILLAEYFLNNALRVVNSNAIDSMTSQIKEVYEILPDTFTTSEFNSVAKGFGISKRTSQRILSNKQLFHKLKKGFYDKLV